MMTFLDGRKPVRMNRGTTTRQTLSCGCVIVSHSDPEMPYSREAVERHCEIHQSEPADNLARSPGEE